ncbi:ribonuclease R [Patescibacteria group bacterium]|nr:ribonuclease R [Patescibacteria group bacterium]
MDEKDRATYEGPIEVTRRGIGFFKFPLEEGKKSKEDLLIPADLMKGAFPGDTVKVAVTGSEVDLRTRAKRDTGTVIEILSRSRMTFVGKLIVDPNPGVPLGQVILIPDWKKMYTSFVVRGENLPVGFKVVVRFKDWVAGQPMPWGVVEEIIGPAGIHETEMRALALSQGFHSDFPPGVIAESTRLESEGKAMLARDAEDGIASGRRKDFRGTSTFTIDPFDAKDFDDALSVKFLSDGTIEVGVHIADVSFFVRPGDAIDVEAQARATSVYLVDRTIPMLPEVLSNNLCSLVPNEDRLSVSAVFTLNKNAEIISKWFGETVIHSDKRFTYEDAQKVLDTNEGEMRDELVAIRDLARKIRVRRTEKGAIAFDTAEIKVKLDENGKPIEVVVKERKETNLLIEDFMLLANESVAEELAAQSKKVQLQNGFIYRVHDVPNADRIEDLSQFLRVMGYELETHAGRVKGSDLNALLKKVEGTPEEYLIKTAALRSMAKATYTTKNIGHFGLAFSYYTHFTSPIRRYPDLLVHRMVKHFSGGEKIAKEELLALDALALHSSEREVAAAHAERDSVKMKLVEYMEDKVGQEFDAVISGVSDRGIYVELIQSHAEGMVRIRDLGNDYFTYDEKRYRLVGQRTQKQFSLGDPLRVKLSTVRLFEREMDFQLVA